ncbi:MAG: hypothetical protein QNJ32_28920 [Xenococcaceae cyanobacterium MO_167.B27]|nr:hypothetical protein [Xenococcaceae cyanobacterium MO_167.B27]
MIKKTYAKLALFIALGTGLISPESAKASNNIAQCFSNNVKYEILAHYQIEQADYYLVEVVSLTTEFLRNVIKVDNTGNCSTVVGQKEIRLYPLSNFLGKEIAYNLLTSRYLTLIKQFGGVEPFKNAFLGSLDAASPHNFFEETVIVLKRLGIDLAKETPNLIIVGEEGIPGHPELQFKE